MAINIKYNKLFEVRILHAFALKTGVSFFSKTSVQQAEELIDFNYNIAQYLKIVPTEDCRKLLKNHRLLFKDSPLGFFVGVETAATTTNANSIKPAIEIAENTVFNFKIQVTNSDWINITNLSLNPAIRAKYYFSNYQNLGELTAPSLARFPKMFNANQTYEMGEIVTNGSAILQATRNVDGTLAISSSNLWASINNDSLVTNQDNILVPLSFKYHFNTNAGVAIQDVVFTLKTLDNQIIKTISINETTPFSDYVLDFRKIVATDPIIESGRYLLEVNSPNGYSAIHTLQISTDTINREDFGIISIAHQANLNDFRLLENNGELRQNSGQTQTPVFEIRFKNRATYWRFIQHASDNYTLPSGDPNFKVADKIIRTKTPLPLSKFYVAYQLPTTSINIPNPSDYTLQRDEAKERYISEIFLPKLNI